MHGDKVAGSDWPAPLCGCFGVALSIANVVDEIDRAGQAAEAGHCPERQKEEMHVAELAGKDDRRQHEQVLQPLPRPHGDQD